MTNPWLSKFLNVYWLRPENALWRAVNCAAMEDLEFKEPSLDLACGDGIFSFLRAGGDFDRSFDIFDATGNLESFYENVDIYDSPAVDYSPVVSVTPQYRMTVGIDWKQNLIDKASALDFYRELYVHDSNEPLPFEDDSFQLVFSNSIYWFQNLENVLREITRVLKPGGTAVLVLKTTAILDYTLDAFSEFLGSDLLKLIDRGRRESYPHLQDNSGWQARLTEAGLQVVSVRPQITWLHSHLWDVGLRPISPFLIEMANSLSEEKRLAVKTRWIEVWEKLLSPFAVPEIALGFSRLPAEIIYVARKGGRQH